ncbi:MAG: (d)CMP kinase [Deltaproteobacteria bacterium]|nr:MAG: (d)CMP kinase [Deltaproteobacteria bacterium]
MIIAIDGPSGAGKSTLAKRLARELGFIYLDTGAMYRALALKVLRQGVDLADDARLARLVESIEIDLQENNGTLEVLLDGINVANEIRTPEVSQLASKVSALKIVRARMLDLQRGMGKRGSVVAEGRDIGTVVFPNAEVKIFLDASAEERARRRCAELRAAGRPADLSETLREMEERDKRDSERDLAPLRMADDALRIDSSNASADSVAAQVLAKIRNSARVN